MLRFIKKFRLALELKARLLETPDEHKAVLAEIRATRAYVLHHKQFEALLQMELTALQALLRKRNLAHTRWI